MPVFFRASREARLGLSVLFIFPIYVVFIVFFAA